MSLVEYQKKRRFGSTPEPSGREGRPAAGKSPPIFVVQKHLATQLHYDFRLEWRGVLLSWAVPKGPSLDPSVKRLAVQVEDHPIEYAGFEGVIPEGEYGAGTVMVWDAGTWEGEQPDVAAAMEKGDLKFTLHGKKLQGSWVLVRTRGYGTSPSRTSWLLIKHRDEHASAEDVVEAQPCSVLTGRRMADIAREAGGDAARAAAADPASGPKAAAARRKRPAPR